MNWDPDTLSQIDSVGLLIEVRKHCDHLEGFGDRYDGLFEKQRWRLSGVLSKTPGYSDLQALSEADGSDGIEEWLALQRVKLARTLGMLPSEIDKMPITEFARLLVAPAPTNGSAREAHVAHAEKLFPLGVPESADLRDAILELQSKRTDDNTDAQILRDFFNGDNQKVKSIARQIRALRSNGRTTLPPRRKRT